MFEGGLVGGPQYHGEHHHQWLTDYLSVPLKLTFDDPEDTPTTPREPVFMRNSPWGQGGAGKSRIDFNQQPRHTPTPPTHTFPTHTPHLPPHLSCTSLPTPPHTLPHTPPCTQLRKHTSPHISPPHTFPVRLTNDRVVL